MFQEIIKEIPDDIFKFFLVTIFSLLIGLEQRQLHSNKEFESIFGTDRTFTLIGILGFILYRINPQDLIPFLVGIIVISLFLGLFYFAKMREQKFYGMTSLVTALITYCLAPLIYTQSVWLVLLIIVSVLILTEMKKSLFEFTQKFDNNEFITLSIFIVIAGVILPLLPTAPISATINISPYKFWLAIVAVSGISYCSYLLKKFVFPKSGIILTGILGGLYSSTVTSIILAKKSKETPNDKRVSVAIILATTMMYLRIFLLALFFNPTLAFELAPTFGVLIIISALIAVYLYKYKYYATPIETQVQANIYSNPLEFKTSLLFGSLFILFALITTYVNQTFGSSGINVLSFVVGVTDIDPFIINLLQSKLNISDSFLVMAIVNATTSNNFLKMIYGISLCDKSIRKDIILGFGILIVSSLLISFVFI
ncbi:MgtC/SapB family protein [Flavobacterium cellulosilyticum]|uniref:DUF4010 domain-containing protein n=1 Tax=Flavobacterium cellulosilyticum TaxID=2541731 RepID=A0A4R5C669_9FLAO|nr:DUF4010 domain-containing protein [Flavobacterium cellulosilyticum]TDD94179.1 DUF4010 domain-containing protein [Flavobacterium cellulosilyticum]